MHPTVRSSTVCSSQDTEAADCLSTEKQITKMWRVRACVCVPTCAHTQCNFYSTIREWNSASAAMWMDWENITLREISQTERLHAIQIFYDITCMCNLKNNTMNVYANRKWKVTQSCPTLCDPMNCPGQNTGVGSFSLLWRIFPTQGSNPGLPLCGRILYQLSHKGSPKQKQTHRYRQQTTEGVREGVRDKLGVLD